VIDRVAERIEIRRRERILQLLRLGGQPF